jgi:hypothetical protein
MITLILIVLAALLALLDLLGVSSRFNLTALAVLLLALAMLLGRLS